MSNEKLEKLVSTSSIGGGPGGGYLKTDQADQFIDRIWDAAVLWREADKQKMNSSYKEWSTVRVGARIVRGATEGVATQQNATANFTKVSISTQKFRLDWELTTEALEDNIEGEALDQHLLKLFTHQLAQDLEEVSVHGDENSSDPLLGVMDGWHTKALTKGHVVPAATGTGNAQLSRMHFNQALRRMPPKYKRSKGDLRFYASSELYQDYLFSQSEQGIVPNEVIVGTLRQYPGPQGAAGDSTTFPFGVQLLEVPTFDTNFNEVNAGTGSGPTDTTSFIELTNPKNRLVGMQREIKIHKQYNQHKDAIEYTCYVRFGLGWQNDDAVVTVTGIPVIQY